MNQPVDCRLFIAMDSGIVFTISFMVIEYCFLYFDGLNEVALRRCRARLGGYFDYRIDTLPSGPKACEALRDECADVLLYLLLIAARAGINLEEAAGAKFAKNAAKHPVEKSYGTSRSYSRLDNTAPE